MKQLVYLFLFTMVLSSCSKQVEQNPVVPDPELNVVYGGSALDHAFAATQSLDGSYILAGSTQSNDGDVTGNHGDADAWVLKNNKDGKITWQKTFGGSALDGARSIASTQAGGFIMAGFTYSNDGDVTGNHGDADAWLVNIDKDGNMLWQKTLGGSSVDNAYSIIEASDGGYIIAGRTASTGGDVSNNHGGADAWVVKLDRNGNKQWQKTFGGSGSDAALSIIETSEGGYIMAGFTASNDGDVTGYHAGWGMDQGSFDGWVVRMDKDGNLLWTKAFGGFKHDVINSITEGLDNTYTIAGFTRSQFSGDVGWIHGDADAWVVNIDRTGKILWQNPLGGSGYDIAYSITTTRDGGYMMAGSTSSNDGDVSGSHGGSDAWTVKLDRGGKLRWQKVLGGSGDDVAYSIFQHTNGLYAMGGVTFSNDGNVTGQHGAGDIWMVTMKDQ